MTSAELSFKGGHVVVTGGTGFIGYAFLSKLRSLYPDVVPIALARPSSDIVRLQRLLDYQEEEPSVVIGSLDGLASLQPCVRNASVVVHLAADMDFFARDVSRLIKINVEGTRNLLEASAREAARTGRKVRFVYVSSTEVIGCTEGMGKADESAPRRPDSDYGRSKVLAEDVVREYSDRLDTVVARPTGVFGPGERFFFFEMMKMVSSGIAVFSPSPMTGRLMFTHIDDVVQGLIICAAHPDAGGQTYHVCSDESVTNREIVETLADVLQCPRPAVFLSERVGVVLMRFIAPIMNFGKRRIFIYHPKTLRQSMKNREYSNLKLRGLGFVPKYSVLSGAEHTLRCEMACGSVKRHWVPSAVKSCIHFVSVVTFVVHRLMGHRDSGAA